MSFMASSSKSQSKRFWHHDVLLIAGSDHEAISALETSLRDSGIHVFVDRHTLMVKVHSETDLTLMLQDMELFGTVIVVFTKEFVHAVNCRYVLDQILQYREKTGKTVLAVFCGVTLEKVLRRISKPFRPKFAEWLTGYAWQSKWILPTSSSSETIDSKIKSITSLVKSELDNGYLYIPRHRVEIRFRVEEVLHLSKYYSEDFGKKHVTIVGIWGIGGIGKTTIARDVYDTISNDFESKSFLKSIKNVLEKENGLVCLQERLLSDISHTTQEKIPDIETGIRQIMTILDKKRALVVLDDVSRMDPLIKMLCTSRRFGFGSMIIITTRNKDLLDQLKVKYIYEMKKLDRSDSFKLLKLNAFKQINPQPGAIVLAKKVIEYCEGLPLLLEVLGSLLSCRMPSEWEGILKKLKSIPTGHIQEKLKISFEYLDDSVKDLLISIACFYVGEKKQYVTQKLSGFGFPAVTGISMLIEWGLLKDDMDDRLDMHDLLQEIAKGFNSNNPKPQYIYDVFLSFRGEDTRKSFATHLYDALKRAGIEVFMDNEIKSGKNISSSLIQAIESSRMSIIIFSINYAGSRWCLQELEKIMECHRNMGQEVLPIFYHVQPTDVRKQIGTSGKALEGLIKRDPTSKDSKLSWRRALTEAANLSGWDLNNYRTDIELIDQVVETVAMKLDKTYLFVANHPVGVKSRMQEIIQLLRGKSYDTILVGIVGMGGIGKTTIAKAIYNEISHSFEGRSFLANIRELWEQDNGQVYLQEQLLSNLTQTRRLKLQSLELGKAILRERLRRRRAFIVLDDVNNMDQLNALCGSREWFGPGTRIIVTTRDEHLLRILQVDNVYNMEVMDDKESLELFSWHAFKQVNPVENFIDLSRRVICYSEGLPLALEILGSYLFDRTVQGWESVLDKLQEIPNNQIHRKLKISYDGLDDDMEKDIFLDICCFFTDKDRYYVAQILDGCGLYAEIGITRLIELSLVKVDKNNKLDMHGLVRDMGREIVRERSPKEPGKRSRLWLYNDVVEVLKRHMGTIAINGLALNLSRTKTLSFGMEAFKKMKRLRLLRLGHVKLLGNYEYLSKELRWLCWHGFPLHYMPENFDQENIIAVDLKHSNLIEVWKNCQLMERLKFLNLSHSHFLIQTPDFSKLPHLETLILKDCPRLSSIHQSIGDLKELILVDLRNSKDLSNLPRSLYTIKSLKTLNLFGCSRIEKLEEDIEQMQSLTTLLANETAITQVPFSLVRLRRIRYVSLCGYEGFPRDVFPSLIQSWMFPTNNARSLLHAFASMPFLLRNLLHSFSNQINAKLDTRPSTSHNSCGKTPALIGYHDKVHTARAENFMSSVIVQVGGSSKIIDTLMEGFSQGCYNGRIGSSLPKDNYPNWLAFEDEGSSVSFKVSEIVTHYLKGMILHIIYSCPKDNMAHVYPVTFMVKNFTKVTIDVYKRDAITTFDEEEWQNIRSNLEPGNEVEIKVDFARKYDVKKTAVYLVYGDEIKIRSGLSITKGLLNNV